MLPDTATHTGLDISRELRDGYEVHRAALARGLNVTLLPRQVMIVENPDGSGSSHAFVHGIPDRSTLAGVTFAQDRRMRRALLARSGFTVPKGATFSVGHSPGAARRYAERRGYPVVAKPALGDNTTEVFARIRDQKQLNRAISHFRKPPDTRKGNTKAAYALTELREPGMRNGKPTAPPGYRFLIEEFVRGEYLRFIVLNGQVRNVLLCPDGPWQTPPAEITDVTRTTHPSLKDIATAVKKAMPGLPLAAIDLVVPDHTATTTTADAYVVEFSERPWLAVQAMVDPQLSADLGSQILDASVGASTSDAGRPSVELNVRIDGSVSPDNLLTLIGRHCEVLEIGATLNISDPAMGYVSGTMNGDPASIAWLIESLIAGTLSSNRPMLVEANRLASATTA